MAFGMTSQVSEWAKPLLLDPLPSRMSVSGPVVDCVLPGVTMAWVTDPPLGARHDCQARASPSHAACDPFPSPPHPAPLRALACVRHCPLELSGPPVCLSTDVTSPEKTALKSPLSSPPVVHLPTSTSFCLTSFIIWNHPISGVLSVSLYLCLKNTFSVTYVSCICLSPFAVQPKLSQHC